MLRLPSDQAQRGAKALEVESGGRPGPWNSSGPTDPSLYPFGTDGIVVATTDGASYQLTNGDSPSVRP